MTTPRRGWRRRLAVHGPLALVLLIAALGLVRVLAEHWREGSALLGGALLVAGMLRIVLPVDRVGLLAIRSRAVDVFCYGGLGLMVVTLALTITRGSLSVS